MTTPSCLAWADPGFFGRGWYLEVIRIKQLKNAALEMLAVQQLY